LWNNAPTRSLSLHQLSESPKLFFSLGVGGCGGGAEVRGAIKVKENSYDEPNCTLPHIKAKNELIAQGHKTSLKQFD